MSDLRFEVSFGNNTYLDMIEEKYFDPSHFITRFHIDIFLTEEDEDGDLTDGCKIGFIRLSLIEVDKAVNNGVSLFDVVDSINSEFHEVLVNLLDVKTGDIKEKFYNPLYPNFIYLEKLYIYKKFRGNGYAKRILKSIEDIVEYTLPISFGILAMLPSAFEYVEEIDETGAVVLEKAICTEELPDGKERTQRLVKFYKSVGFKAIGRTKVFIMAKPF